MKTKHYLLIYMCLFVFCVSIIGQNTKQNYSQRKVALVVGVSNYEFAGVLHNTLNDANDISNKLWGLGFDVVKVLDPDIKNINQKVDSITKALTSNDIFLFYFSGHGAEYNGENYLFLKNSNPTVPTDMPFETFPVGKLLGKIEYAAVKTNIMILDACRSNPFIRSWSKGTTTYEGLGNINAPSGSFIGFAASPGKTASDGDRRNGTYTEAILKYIELKNITIDDLFNKVNKEVRIQTAGKQIPFKNSSLEDNLYLNFDSLLINRVLAKSTLDSLICPVSRPKYKMPNTVKGFLDDRINSFGRVSINKTTFNNNENIELSLSIFDISTINKATPVFVSFYHRLSPTSRESQYDEEFKFVGKDNIIKFSTNFPSGKYELMIGFYLLSEMNQEYPPFHKKLFTITIL